QLLRGYAIDRGFLTSDADLSPERRLCGGNGSGIATYRELLRNLASKASPENGALTAVLSRHFTQMKSRLVENGILPEGEAFLPALKKEIYRSLSSLEGQVGGFDFSSVLCAYYDGCITENEEKKSAALRWLRGEFVTKTEAKKALGIPVGVIIADDNWYEFIKLWAAFAKKIGYMGLIVFIDECVNLFKIPNRIAREANYEKLLAIFNDTLQGRAGSLGIIFSGTPQFLEDTRRGLFSYEALRSRLADSRYQEMGYRNLSAPVIRLRRLSDNELLALLARLTLLWKQKYPEATTVSEAQMEQFLAQTLDRAGAEEMLTPREMIRNYLSLLAILRDNPEADFASLVGEQSFEADEADEEDGDFFDFAL
ncbi:MAG: ATP-binding protein, partial [Clostridia bacterium]|nr:ATP-binding protein [Clostridia bacterium]